MGAYSVLSGQVDIILLTPIMIIIPTIAVIYACLVPSAALAQVQHKDKTWLHILAARTSVFFGGKVVRCAPPRMERMTNRLARATHCCRDVPQPEDYSFILNFDSEAQTTDIAHNFGHLDLC